MTIQEAISKADGGAIKRPSWNVLHVTDEDNSLCFEGEPVQLSTEAIMADDWELVSTHQPEERRG